MTLAAGDKAPDFDLPTDDGRVALKDLKGKSVVLYFYPKDDTSGCTAEAQGFTAAAADFARAGAVVVGVSRTSRPATASSRANTASMWCWARPRTPTWSSATAPGSKKACTAASTWASIAPRS